MNITHGRALTRKDASDITRLLMAYYHEGVVDAHRLQDDSYCLRFADECRRMGTLGVLETGVCSSADFLLHMLVVCRKFGMGRFGHDVVYNLPNNSPLMTLCMLMYLDGACAYAENPNTDVFEGFGVDFARIWPSLEVVDVRRFAVTRVTELCVEMINLSKSDVATRASMLAYNLWLLTRPIGSAVKK